jgi:glutamyl-tRNA reductase
MRLVAVGMSHHTAPIELRERLALPADGVPELLRRFQHERLGAEAVLLSTCNRVELYAVPRSGSGPEEIAAWLAEAGGLRARTVQDHLFRFAEQDALKHVFRVAASLDSMVLGEPQIVSQLKDAYRLAAGSGGAGPVLHRVMDRALSVAARVRSETPIAREAVSVGRAGVELARQVLGDLRGRSALLVGAGAHGKLVAKSLLGYGLTELVVANRTFARAVELAERFGGTATHLEELETYLHRVDVVITSTGANKILVHRGDLQRIMRRRRYRSLVMIDLSVPRNIDPNVNDLDGVYRFDVDDLREVADTGVEKRRAAAAQAEAIVAEETARAWKQLQVEAWQGHIGAVVRRAESIRAHELDRALVSLGELDPKQRRAVEAMTRAIIKKVLHPGLAEARTLAEAGDLAALETVLRALGGAEVPVDPPVGEG